MARVHFTYFDLDTGFYPEFHHGLAYIISTLRNDGHNVSLRHLREGSDFNEAVKFLEKESPDLHGLSFATNQKKHVLDFLKITKPSARLTIAGGVHCSLVKEKIFEDFPGIEGICIGEGEVALKELCKRLDANENHTRTPSFYFKAKNKIIKNPIAPLQQIDSLPLPDYSLFNYNKIITESGSCFQMVLSRGCPYECSYCCNHALRRIYPDDANYTRFPSPRHAIKIVSNNLRLYPRVKKIIFSDDNLIINKQWLYDFCELYKKEIALPFLGNARVELIDSEIVQYLRHAGCKSLNFGVETGNERLRADFLNKNNSNREIKSAFYIAKQYGIKTFSYNMVGLPFETKYMADETLKLNLELQPYYGRCHYFYPYPGTRLYELCLDYGLLLDDIESIHSFLERPSLKETFMSHKEVKKHLELLQVYFYVRILLSKIKVPFLFENLLLKTAFLFRKPVVYFFHPKQKNKILRMSRNIIRGFALRYLR